MIIAIIAIAASMVIIIPERPTWLSVPTRSGVSEDTGAQRARKGSRAVNRVQSRAKTITQTDILFRVFLNVKLQFIINFPSEKYYFSSSFIFFLFE